MSRPNFERVVEELIRRGVPESEFVGCSDSEIEELLTRQAVPTMPYEYRIFLQRMGKHAGGFQAGTDAYYPKILDLKESAKDLLAENGSAIQLEANSLVISMHQGYEFAWFPDVLAAEPVVRFYSEAHGDATKEWESLSAYFMDTLWDISK
ncbi:hypothetical protein [Kribbella monticola]|uniref:hypothetical protein n=1 Tax=Kribbella monticola TaxID=2185285 RepID=UPI000DD2E3D3|nr:hypothetical protein [Kribbella monticola]